MAAPGRLLLIRPRFLGDLVLATGLPRAIKDQWPGTRVSLLAESAYAEALRHHPDLDEVVEFDASRKGRPLYLLDFYRGLRRRRFDVVLDLFGNPRTAQMAFLSGAPLRVGFDLRGRRWAYNRLAPPSSPPLASGRRPVTEAYLDQLRALGWKAQGPYRTSLTVTGEEKAHARKLLDRARLFPGAKLAVLAPGASWPAKHWPLEKFARLGAYLSAEGFRILTVFGPKEKGMTEAFQGRMGKDWILIQEPSLRGLMAFIEAADLLVSNDAGPMHIGPAVGTPTLGIFGPGEPEVWFPYAEPHRVLYAEVPCSHCGLDACPLMACMAALTPEAAARAALEMTASLPAKNR
ncbi:MAG TPA: glycosyltransferase family 9 protein [bacterium]|nr:glycosyltransferase family 9 protein [bacterium]